MDMSTRASGTKAGAVLALTWGAECALEVKRRKSQWMNCIGGLNVGVGYTNFGYFSEVNSPRHLGVNFRKFNETKLYGSMTHTTPYS